MRIQKSFLLKAVLASTVFCLFPFHVAIAANLDAGANNSNSGNPLYPPNNGYDFVASNVTFTILNGTAIGQLVGGASIDNTSGSANDVINFAGNSNVLGTITPTNAISAINLQGNGTTVTFNGDLSKGTPVIFTGDGTLSLANTVDVFGVDNNTGSTAGTLIIQGSSTIQSVGATNPLKLITVNANNLANTTTTFDGNVLNAQTVNIVGGGGQTKIQLAPLAGSMVANTNFTTNNNNLDLLLLNKATTLNGNVGSETNPFAGFNVNANSTLNGEVFAQSTVLVPGVSLTLTSGSQIHGLIQSTVAGQGTLIFQGNSTVDSAIGTNALGLVNIHGPAGTNVNFNANVAATNVTVDNGGTLTLNGANTITGNLALSNASILNLPQHVSPTVTGTFNLPAGTKIQVDMGGNLTSTGKITSNGLSTINPGASLIVLNPGYSLGKTTTIPIVNSIGGNAGLNTIPVVVDSLLSQFSTQVTGNFLNLVVTSQPVSAFADQGNTIGVASALDNITRSGFSPAFGAMHDLLAQLGSFTSEEELNEALATLAPIVDGALLNESFAMQKSVFGSIGERMDRVSFWQKHLRQSNTFPAGIASGDEEKVGFGDFGSSIWAKTFRQHANQSRHKGIEGYSDTTWGVVAGYDRLFDDNYLLGGTLSVSQLKAHHHVSSHSQTKGNSYQATLYGDMNIECPLFVSPLFINALVGIAYNDYSTHRNIFFGDLFLSPSADYSGWQTGAEFEAGYIFSKDNRHIIPTASLFYSYLDLTGYDETGAGTVNQTVSASHFDTLIGSLGSKLIYDYACRKFLYQPEVHANINYAFLNSRMETTSQFIGAGPGFVTRGAKPERLGFNLGTSITLFTHSGFTFMANYDYEFKTNYHANAAFIRTRYELL
ncbi:MAG: hypothetical protein BGO43_08190 [Gammaproteobacteria bacterium 39-13]|nr:autotransporter domain-containing protein [Gammaproteobacteria bacterium]OJV91651.1 MAG: hypothetical protein BGO43_08190 [Gammaproteobacteria bacterium 39-13]